MKEGRERKRERKEGRKKGGREERKERKKEKKKKRKKERKEGRKEERKKEAFQTPPLHPCQKPKVRVGRGEGSTGSSLKNARLQFKLNLSSCQILDT